MKKNKDKMKDDGKFNWMMVLITLAIRVAEHRGS